MKKKGFTLIEMLAVIIILGILSAVLLPSIFSMVRKAKTNSYEILIETFEDNAKLYISRHQDEVETSLNLYNYYTLTLNDLNADNLLKNTPIIDPRTDLAIDLTKKIIVTRETDNSLDVCFEDRVCYIPTLLVNELTAAENIVTGTTEGLHYDTPGDFYYYRGSNPDNWITFNGYLWRIVKINTDGSIKIVYEGVKTPTKTEQNGTIGSTTFDSSNVNNYDTSISIKTYLQTWYDANILTVNKSKVASKNWCIGKTTYNELGVTKETFFSDECITQTSSTLPIGLITGKDYLYASLDATCLTSYKTTGDQGFNCKNSNYLYKNAYNYWSLTADETTTNVWGINTNGALGATIAANTSSNVRPVLNLINGLYIDKGNGTFDNPYILKDIVSVDKEKPVITIIGSSPVYITQGSSYVDANATAMDNVDGNITSKIIKLSDLNPNVVGTYTVTYVVSDNSGNKKSASRIVIVKPAVNEPVLAAGMVPVKWDGSTWVNTTVDDEEWYKYTTTDKQWANAKTSDGSMWVWIPRYVYKIESGWHSSTVGTIDIQFSSGTDDTKNGTVILANTDSSNDSNGTWTNHPAFTFGTTELTGIWVAKFEASGATSAVDFLPNVTSILNLSIGDMFTASRNIETNSRYGWGITGSNLDTHLMKNTEWGAAAYLSQSLYGKNSEIWINNSSTYTTGCAGNIASDVSFDGCANIYSSINGVKASTTGNIYGIYDMSGGAWEKVSAYINNGDTNLSTYGSAIISSNTKYKDVYSFNATDTPANNYTLSINKKGAAVYETSSSATGITSWYSDSSYMLDTITPWFHRGGSSADATDAGIFNFHSDSGAPTISSGFRTVLLVESGL